MYDNLRGEKKPLGIYQKKPEPLKSRYQLRLICCNEFIRK